jgi:hypothetical protein
MSIVDQANAIVSIFAKEIHALFPERVISIFLLGSLNSPEIFSPCSDVDVAVMLDNLKDKDGDKINHLQTRIANLDLPFSDKLSIFWSSYHVKDFVSDKGRFPPLDRLILVKQATHIYGDDHRSSLPAPTHREIISGGADFIYQYMLPDEKMHELLDDIESIVNKGARYFTKFILFPVRLIFSLDNPNMLASNLDAVNYFRDKYTNVLSNEALTLVNIAYLCRQLDANTVPSNIELILFQEHLSELYEYCLQRYYEFMLANNLTEQARQLPSLLTKISENRENRENREKTAVS